MIRASAEEPFGVRAIEKGCEVDGVWNSRTATPLHSPVFRSRNSSPVLSLNKLRKSNRVSSGSSISALDIPEPAHLKIEPSTLLLASTVPQEDLDMEEVHESLKSSPQMEPSKFAHKTMMSPGMDVKKEVYTHTIAYSKPEAPFCASDGSGEISHCI